jgi:hypothetical protein
LAAKKFASRAYPQGRPASGRSLPDLWLEEQRAFWAWAIAEIPSSTGLRMEELLELSACSIVEYRQPDGTPQPLLRIAPSKADSERILPIFPELARALMAVRQRVGDPQGRIPCHPRWDAP